MEKVDIDALEGGILMYPDRKTAEALLTEAEPHNPGPWGDHSP